MRNFRLLVDRVISLLRSNEFTSRAKRRISSYLVGLVCMALLAIAMISLNAEIA